jgi:hypothetical protein
MILLVLEWALFNFECGFFTCASHSPFTLALRPALTFLAITMIPLIMDSLSDKEMCTRSCSGKSSSDGSSLRSFSLKSASISSVLSSHAGAHSVIRHEVLASSETSSMDALAAVSKPREDSWHPVELQEPFLLNHTDAEQGISASSTPYGEEPGMQPCSCHRPVSRLTESVASSVSSTAAPAADAPAPAPAPAPLPICDVAEPGLVDPHAAEGVLVQQLASLGPAAQARALVLYNIEVSQGPTAALPSPGPAVHSSLYTSTTERKLISIKVCCHLPMLCWEYAPSACLPSCCFSDFDAADTVVASFSAIVL